MSISRKYVAVEDQDGSGMFCLGIFYDHKTAVGAIMEEIWDFRQSYQEEGCIFEHTELSMMEGEGGEIMTLRFKAPCWEKEMKYYYYILYSDMEMD